MRVDTPPGGMTYPPPDPEKFNFYRIGHEQSEVIFWPAEQVDAAIRP